MFEFSQSKNRIIIKRNIASLVIGVVVIIMALAGVQLVFGLLPFEEGYTFSNILSLIFVYVWIIATLIIGIFALATNNKQITINSDGILCVSWFSRKFVKWENVKDWGLSYCGETRWKGNTYHLYFAEHECQIKTDCKKKLKGKMIKTFVIGSNYFEAVAKIIPFCEENTNITPFIGKYK